jgi:tripartite-type tricarboxylate transporter receptor subunit TctC
MSKAVQVRALAAALAAAMPSALHAAPYPERAVKVIVPFPPGGVTDIAARVITQKLSERLGQQLYIENIGGAGGNLGMANAARAGGDGYTVLFASSSIVVNPSLYKHVPFDAEKDFIPVTEAGASPNSWLVNNDFPARTMNELIEAMKANPGKLSVASPGAGTTPSLSIEMLKQGLGVRFVTVPFAGGGPMTQSLLGGFTPVACAAIANSVALIKEGKIRALAITSRKHLETLPAVPTLDEIGIKDQEAETMTGVFVPAGTPQPIVQLLATEISAIVRMPEVRSQLLELGIIPEGSSSADFAAYIKAEIAKWKRVIEAGKIDKI